MIRARGGFTLVEILVVIVIIGILVSLAVVGASAALHSARHSSTEALLTGLSAALEQYKSRWGDYPPTALGQLKGVSGLNEVNNGAEAMTACLASTLKGGSLLGFVKEEQYVNIDGDSAGKNLTSWFFGDNQLREIADPYGYPVAYVHHKDYSKASGGTRKYRFQKGAPEQTFEPSKSEATKVYVRPDKFQLLSPGRDGKIGTGDDVKVP